MISAPPNPDAHVLLGNMQRLELDTSAAESSYRAALAIDPAHVAALSNLSLVLRDRGGYDEADDLCRRALVRDMSNVDVLLNAAASQLEQNREEEGKKLLRRVYEIQPDCAHAHFLESAWLLKYGHYAAGWDKYEWRAAALAETSPYDYPEWAGAHAPAGVLLIRAEQGLGDQIMFSSCIADAMQRVPRCIIECDFRLKPIFARSFPEAAIYGYRKTPVETWLSNGITPTMQIAIGSLPRLFRRSRNAFPDHRGYLCADPAKVSKWTKRLNDLGPGPKVGISWRGGVPGTRRHLRSIPLADWRDVLGVPNLHFISLQYGEVTDEVVGTNGSARTPIQHWPEVLSDQDELAALISATDLTLTVQTSVAHLAGALGKEVWILVPAVPEWRYGATTNTMPWYPSASILRQRGGESWQAVLQRAATRLAARFRDGSTCSNLIES